VWVGGKFGSKLGVEQIGGKLQFLPLGIQQTPLERPLSRPSQAERSGNPY
jgi:hypothetical protein